MFEGSGREIKNCCAGVYAPILLFAYNRPRHLKETVEALQQNFLASQSDLVIFSDGPKDSQSADLVAQVRSYAKGIGGFASVELIERDRNFGLASNIISGVTELCSRAGRVIVLEDDMLTSPFFLTYMNHGLDKYADDSRVASVHGYVYPVNVSLPETFFMRGADCWGWATWKRSWDNFQADGQLLLNQLQVSHLTDEFDLDGAYPFSKMLEGQIHGKNDSWAIRWHASVFLAHQLTLYPRVSLVRNIGHDSSGTHCGYDSSHDGSLADVQIHVRDIEVIPSDIGRKAFKNFFRPSMFHRLKRKLSDIYRRMGTA